MRVGTGQICITPPVGVDLCGYGARTQPSIGVHDDLYARALWVEAGAERFLWLHCDLLGIGLDLARGLRREIARALGIAERQALVSATHTHAGPATQSIRGCGKRDAAYLERLEGRLVEVAIEAAARTAEVELAFAEGRLDLAIDRRFAGAPIGHVDHKLPVLVFRRPNGDCAALVANYAMHNVVLTHVNRHVSADAAGVVARQVGSRLAGSPVVFFTNGACGNINPPDQSDDFSLPERYGGQLAEAVLAAARNAKPYPMASLASATATIDVPLTPQSPEEIEREYERSLEGDPESWNDRQMRLWRDETLALIERGEAPESIEMDVQAVRLGPVAFAAIGAEVFSRIADDLRERCGPRTYVVGYANGNIGYLPFAEAQARGGYELDYAYKLYNSFNVAPNAFDVVRDAAAELVERVQ